MIVHLDTSLLVYVADDERWPLLAGAIEQGDRLVISAITLYEWLRGPRSAPQIAFAEALFPAEAVVSFGPAEARLAADLYRVVAHPRRRQADLAIAACALEQEAMLWTRNEADFGDIPGLRLYQPPG